MKGIKKYIDNTEDWIKKLKAKVKRGELITNEDLQALSLSNSLAKDCYIELETKIKKL